MLGMNRREVLADMGCQLGIGQLVGCFHFYGGAGELLGLQPLVKLSFGFAGAKDQERVDSLQIPQDLVIEDIELTHQLPFQDILSHKAVWPTGLLGSRPCRRLIGFVDL